MTILKSERQQMDVITSHDEKFTHDTHAVIQIESSFRQTQTFISQCVTSFHDIQIVHQTLVKLTNGIIQNMHVDWVEDGSELAGNINMLTV